MAILGQYVSICIWEKVSIGKNNFQIMNKIRQYGTNLFRYAREIDYFSFLLEFKLSSKQK
tara:strand:+ start:263 stop:442 length:180 start_codon:yes stop_codon:yes gene_type:complete